MTLRDHVLRLRIYETSDSRKGSLDWKGQTRYDGGFKLRDELSTSAEDPDVIAQILDRLGFQVISEIASQPR